MALSSALAWQWAGFGFTIVIVALWLTGAGARLGKLGHLMTFATWWAVHSIHSRCPTLWDGGDNFTAGLAKVPGKYWQNGTAFYYVLASREFGLTGLGPWIWGNRGVLALMTWAPMVLQLAFPWIYVLLLSDRDDDALTRKRCAPCGAAAGAAGVHPNQPL